MQINDLYLTRFISINYCLVIADSRKIYDFTAYLLFQTYNVDKQVPDSAGTATAMFSGVKCRYRVIGYDAKARYNHCDKAINQLSKLTTIADWAQESGMDTGECVLYFYWLPALSCEEIS